MQKFFIQSIRKYYLMLRKDKNTGGNTGGRFCVLTKEGVGTQGTVLCVDDCQQGAVGKITHRFLHPLATRTRPQAPHFTRKHRPGPM